MMAFSLLDDWPPTSVAAAVIDGAGNVSSYGDTGLVFGLASVTKLLTAAAVLLAVEEGSVALDDEVPTHDPNDIPRGATVADVLAHAGGFGPDGKVLDDPGRRRIYSNGGYEVLGRVVEDACEMSFAEYMTIGIFEPLAMSSTILDGSPAFAGRSTVDDLGRFVLGLSQLLAPETLALMTSPHLPELIGVLPGYGRQTPNPWGLGPELRSAKSPHWTGKSNSGETWGHFGQAGTFVWIDPEVSLSVIVLTNKNFGKWALPLWPVFSDAVREEAGQF